MKPAKRKWIPHYGSVWVFQKELKRDRSYIFAEKFLNKHPRRPIAYKWERWGSGFIDKRRMKRGM